MAVFINISQECEFARIVNIDTILEMGICDLETGPGSYLRLACQDGKGQDKTGPVRITTTVPLAELIRRLRSDFLVAGPVAPTWQQLEKLISLLTAKSA